MGLHSPAFKSPRPLQHREGTGVTNTSGPPPWGLWTGVLVCPRMWVSRTWSGSEMPHGDPSQAHFRSVKLNTQNCL